ncbi:unnamed protein product [Ostreobium quekettii]|uniref:Tudor domain-containing protein n=1 Tax=Ostreobium quekettii TaxID=121088 RepID=A0A8S1IS69_9CHLO|nr:unnamed protein product [Ostreobium quekettii]
MRGGPGRAFHVACPHTGAAICRCSLGGPKEVSTPLSSQQYYQQARALWELWKDSSGMLQKRAGVDVMVPALYRRELTVCEKDNEIEGDLPSSEDAMKALKTAKRAAVDLAAKAAKLATSIGMESKQVKGMGDKPEPKSPKRHRKGCDALQAEITKLEEEMVAMDAEWQALEADKSSKEENIKQKIRQKEQNLAEAERRRTEKSKAPPPSYPGPTRNLSQEQGSPGSAQIKHPPHQPPSAREPQSKKAPQGARPQDGAMARHVTGSAQGTAQAKEPNRSTGQKRRSDVPPSTSKRKLSRLTVSDFSGDLLGRYLKVFWPDDQQWWTVRVHSIDAKNRTAQLLYETDEIEEVNLLELIQRGEVAFHNDRPPQQAFGVVSEAVPPQAEASLPPTSQGAARAVAGPPPQRRFPSPLAAPSPVAQSMGPSQHKHRIVGHGGAAAMPATGRPPSHARDLGPAGQLERGPLVEAGRSMPVTITSILRSGSSVIGQRVQVLLPKDRVWMKAKVVAEDRGNGSLVVRLEIGPKLTLKGSDLVRLV